MTVQTSPLYSMNIQAGNHLLKEITKAIQAAQVNMDKKPKHPHALPPAPKKAETGSSALDGLGGGDMFGSVLGSLFLDLFFGMPMMQGLGAGFSTAGLGVGLNEAAHGLSQLGLMNAQEEARNTSAPRAPQPAPRATSFDEIMIAAQQTEQLQAVAGQSNKMRQMVLLRQMLAMLLAQMMTTMQEGEGGKSGQGEGDLVPDVLRDPKLARFKQNRQSISCIRTLFSRQSSVIMPKATMPHLKFAA